MSVPETALFRTNNSSLYDARSFFFEYFDVEMLAQKYKEWVERDDYLLLQNLEDESYKLVKCAKRGNEVYRKRTFSISKRLELHL